MMGSTLSTALQNEGLRGQVTARNATHRVARWRNALFLALMASLILPDVAHGADLVVVRGGGSHRQQEQQLETAAEFYGISVKWVSVTGANTAAVIRSSEQGDVVGLAVEAEALAAIRPDTLLPMLKSKSGVDLPLLLFGFEPGDSSIELSAWSGGAISSVSTLAGGSPIHYQVGPRSAVTGELGGVELPFAGTNGAYFVSTVGTQLQVLLGLRNMQSGGPSFVESRTQGHEIFLLCGAPIPAAAEATLGTANIVDAFSPLAPAMMFVKYAAGDRGWHSPGHYANLTIDDPWLRQPYGAVDYRGLLAEMDKHQFHTTIAFIPWNYDRSQAEVVALFRSRPDRFSISVHGDNHDHKEFEDLRNRPLTDQIARLEQAQARMDKFQQLTGIPYDHVFVFPHSIGDEPILNQLKSENFLATVNSTNYPMDRRPPADSLYALRPVTIAFGDFPSVLRYPAEMPQPRTLMAVNGFLGNPLLFYVHQDYFSTGVGAFNHVADEVNSLEPSTHWSSLGTIASHLYLERTADLSDHEVLSFSSAVSLQNNSNHVISYQVEKAEPDASLIQSVQVNGKDCSYKIEAGTLKCRFTLQAGQNADWRMSYRDPSRPATVDIGKRSLRVYLLREASDFRDIELSRFSAGAWITREYYSHDASTRRAALLALVVLAALIGIVVLVKAARRQRTPEVRSATH